MLIALICPMLSAGPALADHGQISILESDPLLLGNPVGSLRTVQELGISTVRLSVRWQSLAPDANSFRAPRHFNAASPAAYAKSKWAPYDALVRTAAQDGVRVDMDLTGGAPLWATGRGMPRRHGYPFRNWAPSASKLGQFARAVAIRYSGKYNPVLRRVDPGNSEDLPRVSFWSVWNEPNYGPSLSPQAPPGHSSTPYSPRVYRGMVGRVWSALHATGHGSDTLLIGELAPRGVLSFGKFNMMPPLLFLRSLYCLGGNYRPLRGSSAKMEGCPTTSRGSRAFASHNPALFHSSGVADHPYMRWFPPNQEKDQAQPKGYNRLKHNYATLATIGQLESGLNRMLGAYHSRRKLPVWITEFGYITDPPVEGTSGASYHYPSPTLAAYYDNWAEYIAWKNPRIASFDQYILQDPSQPPGSQHQGFPSGLIFASGQHKPGFDAFRLPLYLPHTTASGPGQSLEIWGAARPAYYAHLEEPGSPESVTIMFKADGGSQFVPLTVVPISSPEGYFDTQLQFSSSGTVKLAWTYPSDSLSLAGTTVYSRTQGVTVR
ncbi:MAG TPA: hypothetical protein VG321_08780 [Solirubrobacteraceae bacterium]|nr:hypothetical protein [Solirubrobacteraceae bacterium]